MVIKDNSLSPDVLEIIRQGATEKPHTGTYNNFCQRGTYLCRGCGAALFRAHSQFNSSCGWPSFDEALMRAVTEQADRDGVRIEIVCTRCAAHSLQAKEGRRPRPVVPGSLRGGCFSVGKI